LHPIRGSTDTKTVSVEMRIGFQTMLTFSTAYTSSFQSAVRTVGMCTYRCNPPAQSFFQDHFLLAECFDEDHWRSAA